WLNTAAAMIGISSGIGTPRLPSKSTAKTPRYVKLSTNSWSASTASSRANDAAPAHVRTLTQCSRRVARVTQESSASELADLPLQRLLLQLRVHSDHRGPVLAAELRERVGVQTGRQDLQRLDDPWSRSVEVGVAVSDVDLPGPHGRPGFPRQRAAKLRELFQRSVERKAARADQHDIRRQLAERVHRERRGVVTRSRDLRGTAGHLDQLGAPHPPEHKRLHTT